VTEPICVQAWAVAEGDVLPGGKTVFSVLRDPASDRVTVATTDGIRRELRREDRLVIARRAVPDGVTDRRWRKAPGGPVANNGAGDRLPQRRRWSSDPGLFSALVTPRRRLRLGTTFASARSGAVRRPRSASDGDILDGSQ
jgi:hypothetical protein